MMHRFHAVAVTIVLALLGAAAQAPMGSFDFEDAAVGKLPAGFITATTGEGEAGAWSVKEDASSPKGPKVLAQTSTDKTNLRFPMCLREGLKLADLDVSVQFKPVSGEVDQAGGLVARWRDKDNYYIVRANALEENVRLYKVEGGKRKQLAGAKATVATGKWHSLKLSLRGAKLEVRYDGKPLLEATDETFREPGLAGLWTKADSVTHFDDLRIEGQDKGAGSGVGR